MFNEARKLQEIQDGNQISSELMYNIALTNFDLRNFVQSIECLDKILSRAYESYPQLA